MIIGPELSWTRQTAGSVCYIDLVPRISSDAERVVERVGEAELLSAGVLTGWYVGVALE